MTIANRVKQYLDSQGVDYDVVSHPRTATSSESAQAAHISGERMVKSVVIQDGEEYLLAVVPTSHRVELGALQDLTGNDLGMASEAEIARLFDDCDLGAVPPIGAAYGLAVVLDDSLDGLSEVYFEGGDHTSLVHVGGDTFRSLMKDARHGRFSHHM